MQRNSKSRNSSSQECKCQRSACQKHYCRCFNAGRKCSTLCKCLGCKNVPQGPTDNASIKTQAFDKPQTPFNVEITNCMIRVLFAKAFQLQSEGSSAAQIERQVLMEFNNCFNEIAHNSQWP